jgi:hypothetical protein
MGHGALNAPSIVVDVETSDVGLGVDIGCADITSRCMSLAGRQRENCCGA